MKKFAFFVFGIVPLIGSFGAVQAYNLTDEIPEVQIPENNNIQMIPNVAQYGDGDWSGVVGIARNITRQEAIRIARENPEITFFFYTKGYQMVLGNPEGDYRVFHHGDTVFFKGEPWWGSANDLADGYVRLY